MIRKLLATIIPLLFLASCADDPFVDALRNEKVSYITLELNDDIRQRPLSTKVWYPAKQSAVQRRHRYDNAFLGFVVKEGEIKDRANIYPLVLLSHGTGGSNSSLSWLAEILASNGFVVAAPNHWNNFTGNNSPSGIIRIWDRPKDLSFLIDYFLSDSEWSSLIDESRIYAAGFSAGGFSVLGLAGAKYSFEKMSEFCRRNPNDADCAIVQGLDLSEIDTSDANVDYMDSRVRAVLAMAPAVGRGVVQDSLRKIDIPVHIVAAEDDEWLAIESNAQLYVDNISTASLTLFDRGGHFVFMQECSLITTWVVRFTVEDDICGLASAVDRRELQHVTASIALGLFRIKNGEHDRLRQPPGG
jgi:predicted dienelactone hydrolase